MPLQDVYLDEKGKLVENFRVAAFGHIDGDQTPLHYAAKAGSASCVKLLLQGHADANFKDSHLRTAVHIAAMLGAVEALDVLLSTKCIDPVFNRKYDADFCVRGVIFQRFSSFTFFPLLRSRIFVIFQKLCTFFC